MPAKFEKPDLFNQQDDIEDAIYRAPEPAKTIEQELAAIGIGHRPSTTYGKRECFVLDTGEVIGQMDANEASEFIHGWKRSFAWADAFKAACAAKAN